ncbi:DsbA family protein [Roseivivax sp.]
MKRMISATALAAVLGLGGFWALERIGTPASPEFDLPGAAQAQDDSEDAAPTGTVQEMVLGAEDAPVEVIEYASYTCPHCASFHENVFDRIKENYVETGQVKFVYREVYFDKYGMWASLVARCGGNTDRFFGITDMIYETQSEWARAGSDAAIADGLRKIGKVAGLDDSQLEACLTDGDQLRSLVEWYQENAEADGIRSTPSFMIDGELHSNMNYDDFAEILDEKIAAAE